MSWDYTKRKARCAKCGREGFCIEGSNDSMQSSTKWEGFKSEARDELARVRERAGVHDRVPVCECGSREIVVER
jgi:hypothetical protein